jgi:hypothetical protein
MSVKGVKGGQGRSADEISGCAFVVFWILLLTACVCFWLWVMSGLGVL